MYHFSTFSYLDSKVDFKMSKYFDCYSKTQRIGFVTNFMSTLHLYPPE